MSPGFGQQPRFIVTIQPVGTSFNPPAAIAIPNVDGLKPRQVTELYSYDHDLATFVAIGTGTVSEDGSVIKSDPGVGVLKAGWHCGGDPNDSGSCCSCSACQKCSGSTCANDDSQTPPQIQGNCRRELCLLGSVGSVIDDSDPYPGKGCCNGKDYIPAVECCVGGTVQQKWPILNLDACPNRVQRNPPKFNGCGSPTSVKVPDQVTVEGLFGFTTISFLSSCNVHDVCYDTCGSVKSSCDSQFLVNLSKACSDTCAIDDPLCLSNCRSLALTYASAVAIVGTFAYETAQKNDCQCCGDTGTTNSAHFSPYSGALSRISLTPLGLYPPAEGNACYIANLK